MAVRMELSRILIRELNDMQIIELREVGDGEDEPAAGDATTGNGSARRTFPIVIGLPEAQAIERRLKGVPIKRPQTHDLLGSVIRSFGGTLESITIHDLAEHTFYARLNIRGSDGKVIQVDSRPSDAIALGIANDVPILVEEHVLDAAVSEGL